MGVIASARANEETFSLQTSAGTANATARDKENRETQNSGGAELSRRLAHQGPRAGRL